MNLSLVSTAAAIGLAGGVHCIAMCASPAALATRINGTVSFQAGRVTGYALLGAVAALGAASFSNVATAAAWMRPIWIMLHVAIVLLGGWMLITGRHPLWLQQTLLDTTRALAQRISGYFGMSSPLAPVMAAAATTADHATTAAPPQGQPQRASGGSTPIEIRMPVRIPKGNNPWRPRVQSYLTGMAWALLPCGLLYSVVMLAWMSGEVTTGATAMAVFGVVSGLQLWLGQRGLLALLRAGRESTAIRIAGAVTVLGAGLLMYWAATGHAPEGFCLPGF